MRWFLTWLVLLSVNALGGELVTLAWEANSETNLVGYRVYAGTNSRAYHVCVPTGLVTTQRMELPVRARWFFALTATNDWGLESDYSAEVQWDPRPAPPVVAGEDCVRVVAVIERSTNTVDWGRPVEAPVWFPATNRMEFFRTSGLRIERGTKVE